jgi:hypothetical protein
MSGATMSLPDKPLASAGRYAIPSAPPVILTSRSSLGRKKRPAFSRPGGDGFL